MPSDAQTIPPTVDHKKHAAFFRQSGWMMIASMGAGAMSFGVHFLNKKMSQGDYGSFGTLLMLISCIPAIPLQMVFAQQTASALAESRERQLAGMIQRAWMWTFIVWLIGAIVIAIFGGQIAVSWKLPSTVPLFVTLGAILFSIWVPLFTGVLQGRQDFFWYGWSLLTGGVSRIAIAALLVLVFHAGATDPAGNPTSRISGVTALLTGALAGIAASGIIGIWRTRDLWSIKPERFDTQELLAKIMPLVIAFGVCQFLFTTDTMFAKPHFDDDDMKHYVAAGTLSRALLWLVMPIAAVMFPKIVHSSSKGEKSNLFAIVIAGTAVLAAVGALGLYFVGPFVVRIAFKPGDVPGTVALLPWYAAAMIPLALANVLVNDLMARKQFKVVPFMVVVAVGYGFTLPYMLHHYPGKLTIVLQTLFVYNLLLFLACAWFTWGVKNQSPKSEVPSPI
jgi:O-antigen/teichoic acid export membrane protein